MERWEVWWEGREVERWDCGEVGRWGGREVHGVVGWWEMGRWGGGAVGWWEMGRWREEVSMRVARVIL